MHERFGFNTVQKIALGLGSAMALALTLSTFVEHLQAPLFRLTCIGLFTLLLWVLCGSMLLEKQQQTTVTASGSTNRTWKYKGLRRRALGLTICALPGLAIGGILKATHPSTERPHRITILVANFDGPDKKFGVTEEILESLRELTKHDSTVVIRNLNTTITPGQGSAVARQFAQDSSASVIVWGWYRSTPQQARATTHYEVLDLPCSLQFRFRTDRIVRSSDQKDAQCFKFQSGVSSDIASVVAVSIALKHYAARRYETALPYLQYALRSGAVLSTVADTIGRSDLYVFRAYARWQVRKQLRDAIADYDSAAALNRSNGHAYGGRAVIFAKLGEIARSRAYFDSAFPLFSDTAVYLQERASAEHDSGLDSIALVHINAALSRNAADPYSYLIHARIQSKGRNYPLAIADASKGLELVSPTDLTYRCDKYLLLHARGGDWLSVYRRTGSLDALDAADRDLSAAISLNTVANTPFLQRAAVRAAQGNSRGAVRDLTVVLSRDPTNRTALLQRGRLLLGRLGHPMAAVQDFSALLAAEPNNEDAYFGRATAWVVLNDPARARLDYIRVREVARSSALRDSATAAIGSLHRS